MNQQDQQGSHLNPCTPTKLFLAICFLTLVACGGDGNGARPYITFPIVVNINNLGPNSTLLLTDNGVDNLRVSANGVYQFDTLIPFGSKYLVSIALQPDGQLCTVNNGSGVASTDMSPVDVTCSELNQTHVIGGTVSGLQDDRLMLINNETDQLMVNTSGPFQFHHRIAQHSNYNVAIATQPPGQQCAVTNAEGSNVTHDVNNVIVTCGMIQVAFAIGGTVTGLTSGSVVLNNLDINGIVVDTLRIDSQKQPFPQFVFDKKVVFDGYYKVIVHQNPASQTCSVNHASGDNVTQDVSNIAVNCVPVNNSYTVSGTLSGLDPGTHITLDNDGESLPLHSNGPFLFKNVVANGGEYDVTVAGDFPFLQDCLVRNGNGTITNAPVTNVLVDCTPAPVTALYSFPLDTVNYYPVGLMQAKDGIFYGTATSIKVGTHALNLKTGYIFTITNDVVTIPDDKCETPDSWCFVGAGNYSQRV